MNNKEKEIKDLEYFRKKLKSFLKVYNNDNIITIRDKETCDNLAKMIEEIDKHLDRVIKDELYCYKKEFIGIINELDNEITFNKMQEKPIKTDVKPFNERAYSKLNYLFRKNKLLSDEEAKIMYDNDSDTLYNKYEIFLELINWLNDNGLAIIPEKTLFSAYLGISVETYNTLLNYSSNNEVRNVFKNIDEYFTTNQFGALINNDRKSLERIQKTKTYGQEMMVTQPDNFVFNQTNHLSYGDLMLELKKRKESVIEVEYKEKNG